MELDVLLDVAKKGDEDAKNKILLSLEPLIKVSIKRYCPIWSYYEDLFQDGRIIVLECIETFKADRGYFLAYVKSYLRYFYLDTFKYLLKDQNNLSLDFENELLDLLRDDFDMEESFGLEEDIVKLRENLLSLTKRQRDIVILFYFYGLSLEEIGCKLGISKWTVVNIKRRAIEILRRFYDFK